MPFQKGKTPKGAKPFKKGQSGNPKGREPGSQNRATVYKSLLETRIDVADPRQKGKTLNVTLYEAAALGQIRSAMNGNTNAWKEIQDSLFGKQSNLNFNVNPDELQNLTDAQLDELIAKLSR